MKTLRAFAMLGLLVVASAVRAQPEGMNNSAGGGSSSDIPGSLGSGTAANIPPEEAGVESSPRPGAARPSTMGTPTPGAAGATSGRGVTGRPSGSSGER
jgi:hypothetical protein